MNRTRGRAQVSVLAAASLVAAFLAGCTPNSGSGIPVGDGPDGHDILSGPPIFFRTGWPG